MQLYIRTLVRSYKFNINILVPNPLNLVLKTKTNLFHVYYTHVYILDVMNSIHHNLILNPLNLALGPKLTLFIMLYIHTLVRSYKFNT